MEMTLNEKEQKRVEVLNLVISRLISKKQAAEMMGISMRQTKRLVAAYRKEGVAALVHGNRGKKPFNALGETVKTKVVGLARSIYVGFNTSHYTELLEEREDIKLSRSSVRRILLEDGLNSPRKRHSPKHRSRRERYPQEGMLLQTDGSPHDWLEGRGPRFCLIGAIDDATGKVPYAFFQEQENTKGYMLMLQEIAVNQGIPLALYHDRHSIFKLSADKLPSIEEQLAGKTPFTQFERLLDELNITSIPANSPQAKGRIERLWGTFQDRLVSELRLGGAKTSEEANQVLAAFLPRFNRKFAVEAAEPGLAYRKLPRGFKPEEYFCFKYQHIVGHDNVVRHDNYRLQILPSKDRVGYAQCKVELQERLDNSLAIYYQGKCLNIQPAPLEATALREEQLSPAFDNIQSSVPKTRLPHKPSLDHPWRGKYRKTTNIDHS